jgi:hypothetical protein
MGGKMKLILFFGAGVSAPSDLPTAAELMDKIMHGAYHQKGSHVYAPGPNTDPALRATDLTPRIRKLLKVVMAHDIRDRGRVGYYRVGTGFKSSGAIYRVSTTYEDVFFLCQQISLWNIGLSDNSLTTPFMETIERRARHCLVGRTIQERMWDLARLGSQACDLIETVIADMLRRKYSAGLDLLLELATTQQIEQLNIVTLNHDTLVEQFLSAHGVEFVDGFGPPDGDVRWSDDKVFDGAMTRVQLFKLHGSVDWYRFSGSPKTAILLGNNPYTARDDAGKQLTPMFGRPSFLSGINKVASYQRGIYADIHFRFHQLLRTSDQIVMSGYGWGDTAINFQSDKWLEDGKQNRIILLYVTPERLVDGSLILKSCWDGCIKSGQLASINKYFQDVSLQELQAVLNTSVPKP